MEQEPKAALDEAIRLAGGMTRMAQDLNLSGHSVVYQWTKTRIPADHCMAVERLTGVKCERLRPDLDWDVLLSRPRKRKEAKAEA